LSWICSTLHRLKQTVFTDYVAFAVSQSGLTTFRPYANPLHRRQIFDCKHHALVLISYVKTLRNRRSLLLPLRGFTLAEVLITLGIIGVVAALTIPTLMQSYQNKQYVSGFQKAWGVINNAIELSVANNGFSKNWDTMKDNLDVPYLEKYFLPYFKIIKDCGLEKGQGCMPQEALRIDKSLEPGAHNDNLGQYKILLSDGSAMNLCTNIGRGKYVHIVVDTNGPKKGPNTYGRDIWWFEFNPATQKAYPFIDTDIETNKTLEELKDYCLTYGSTCGAYLVQNGYNMDY
ncbi:prepilin-type N-terminal cleavage/methylation domain-containing protein, partial [bacterium]|nr:prepilin-type N-terminal cleavage/methylation domain-containing protein [bacterium]